MPSVISVYRAWFGSIVDKEEADSAGWRLGALVDGF